MLDLRVDGPAPGAEMQARLDRARQDLSSGDPEGLRELVASLSPGTDVVLEAEPVPDGLSSLARECGLTPRRTLVQLRTPLPLPTDGRPTPAGTMRPFRPGQDETVWLAVNNAAFAWHPEQAGMTPDRLASKIREPWFDAEGFLLWEIDGQLAGFCWTKVHADDIPALGEIFVVGVNPAHQGLGLGRALVRAGLEHLAAQGLRVGMLWTEADNHPAMRLYESLGFSEHHRHVWWSRLS